jgi:hypothetical protein
MEGARKRRLSTTPRVKLGHFRVWRFIVGYPARARTNEVGRRITLADQVNYLAPTLESWSVWEHYTVSGHTRDRLSHLLTHRNSTYNLLASYLLDRGFLASQLCTYGNDGRCCEIQISNKVFRCVGQTISELTVKWNITTELEELTQREHAEEAKKHQTATDSHSLGD